MGIYILVTIFTAIAFFGMILLLAVKPKFAGKITSGFLITAAIGNLLFYSYGYAVVSSSIPLAIIQALLSVCRTFVGGNDYSSISSAPLMQEPAMQVIFWVLHWCSMYATASAAVAAVGVEVLKKLRLWLTRQGDLNLIYGVNNDSVEFGKKLLAQNHGTVVFVGKNPDPAIATAITRAGCVVQVGEHALAADEKFLRSIGWGRRKRNIILYALSEDSCSNIQYARALLNSLQAMRAEPEDTRLIILGQEEAAVSSLQISSDRYGYGFVSAVDEAQLSARLLTRHYPPCNAVSFDENGKAQEDFDALLIGFGQVGQAVLKSLVMNGQFEGSTFHAAVFSPDCLNVDGKFHAQSGELAKHYDISFHPFDARSRQLYEFLDQKSSKLNYIAVCIGSDELSHEIIQDLSEYFCRKGLTLPIYRCSHRGVLAYDADGTTHASHQLYQPELLCHDELDRMAMTINHRYHAGNDQTAKQNWMACDYFSRLSCRASADFMPAMLRAAGKTAQQVMDGDWALTAQQLDNLSRTEHLRWCAFHYCMGFSPMSEPEFAERTAAYLQQKEESGASTIRIGKNTAARTHACLVDWEELDALSARENAITGKNLDYKAMDTANVLVVPELLENSKP